MKGYCKIHHTCVTSIMSGQYSMSSSINTYACNLPIISPGNQTCNMSFVNYTSKYVLIKTCNFTFMILRTRNCDWHKSILLCCIGRQGAGCVECNQLSQLINLLVSTFPHFYYSSFYMLFTLTVVLLLLFCSWLSFTLFFQQQGRKEVKEQK